ncbi:MAG TPA: heavy metal-associated domain-containing protein [Micromonosporaceae bacterium]|nr:heavy metal-associated domain-containing protein [Micromonosporaceae bacterium]
MNELCFSVPDITCGHCASAIRAEVCRLPGVTSVDVDLIGKQVRVTGTAPADAVRDAIAEAGYQAAA